jgi:hypothetical protein
MMCGYVEVPAEPLPYVRETAAQPLRKLAKAKGRRP